MDTPNVCGIYTHHVAGLKFYSGATERWRNLPDLRALVLKREPDNPHDEFAVEVHDPADGMKLGHIPRYLAVRVSYALRNPNELTVSCMKLAGQMQTEIRARGAEGDMDSKENPDA